MLKIRNRITPERRLQKSGVIKKRLMAVKEFKNAKNIFLYYSYADEVDTQALIDECFGDKNIFLPRVYKDHLEPALFQGKNHLKPGYGKIPEPIGTPIRTEISPEKIDLIVVPGVAFDRHGTRLGFGKGYYDKYLKHHKKIPKIGLAFAEQMVDFIPRDPYDIPMNSIITDAELVICNS